MGNSVSYTRFYISLGSGILSIKALHRWNTCSNTVHMHSRECSARMSKQMDNYIYKTNSTGYILLMLMCILFAPASTNKISLSSKQKKIYKFISVIIVIMGLLLYCKIGATKLTSTIFYSFWCVTILMILEQIRKRN